MIRKLRLGIVFALSSVCFASDAIDAEILKDLEFFSSLDVIQDDVAMDAGGDADAILEIESKADSEGTGS